MEKLLLIGAGGYAKSVLDSIDYYNYEVAGFIDEFTDEKMHLGYPVVSKSLEEVEEMHKYVYFVTIGDNKNRKRWYDRLKALNLRMINIVDKSAIISPRASIGTACFIGKMAIINSMAVVEDCCIINTRALVEHGCKLAECVNMSTGAIINGDVKIGEGSFMGSASVTKGQITVGKWSIVGAGAAVTKNIDDYKVVAGVPAKVLKDNTEYM